MRINDELDFRNQVIFSVILGVIITIGTFANIVVLCILAREKQLRRNIASIFLLNLLIIDLSNLLLVMPFSLASIASLPWKPPNGLQKLNGFLGTAVEVASMLALAVISLDRLAAVMKPLAYKARMTYCKAIHCNIYIWIQAIIFSLVPIFCNWYIFNPRYFASTFLSYSPDTGFYIFVAFLISCNFVLSLCIILATYLYIFRVARSHNRRISRAILPSSVFNLNDNTRRESFRQREIRTACKILFVIGAFIICHLPYACLRILELNARDEQHFEGFPITLSIGTKWASFSKSSFNPFIYFLQQKRFRKAFSRLFQVSKNSFDRGASTKSSRNRNVIKPVQSKMSPSTTGELKGVQPKPPSVIVTHFQTS